MACECFYSVRFSLSYFSTLLEELCLIKCRKCKLNFTFLLFIVTNSFTTIDFFFQKKFHCWCWTQALIQFRFNGAVHSMGRLLSIAYIFFLNILFNTAKNRLNICWKNWIREFIEKSGLTSFTNWIDYDEYERTQ